MALGELPSSILRLIVLTFSQVEILDVIRFIFHFEIGPIWFLHKKDF